jgi:hypothetical protein
VYLRDAVASLLFVSPELSSFHGQRLMVPRIHVSQCEAHQKPGTDLWLPWHLTGTRKTTPGIVVRQFGVAHHMLKISYRVSIRREVHSTCWWETHIDLIFDHDHAQR